MTGEEFFSKAAPISQRINGNRSMKKEKSNLRRPVAMAAMAAGAAALSLLAGCTPPLSRGMTDEGQVAEAVFPEPRESAWLKEGSFPNLDNLRAVAPGLTKAQLQELLGSPHFREGLAGVREWDYLFNFREEGGTLSTCQYKVVFDRGYLARSFHWKPADCADFPGRERVYPPRLTASAAQAPARPRIDIEAPGGS